MEASGSRSSNWKTSFKEILAPHLLNPPEEHNDSDDTSNPPEEHNDSDDMSNPLSHTFCIEAFRNNKKLVRKKNKMLAMVYGTEIPDDSFSDSTDDDAEHVSETEEYVASIIAADAEELANRLKAVKVPRHKKYCNMVESSRKPPDWNIAIKKVLDPESFSDRPLIAPMEVVEKDEHLENVEEVSAQSASGNCNKKVKNKKRHNAKVLERPRIFKRPKKPSMNIFDRAGATCFKEDEIKSTSRKRSADTGEPKNVPTEYWDWEDDDY